MFYLWILLCVGYAETEAHTDWITVPTQRLYNTPQHNQLCRCTLPDEMELDGQIDLLVQLERSLQNALDTVAPAPFYFSA